MGKLYYHPNNHERPIQVYLKIHAYGNDNIMELIVGMIAKDTNTTIEDDLLTFKQDIITVRDITEELDILYAEKQKDKDDEIREYEQKHKRKIKEGELRDQIIQDLILYDSLPSWLKNGDSKNVNTL